MRGAAQGGCAGLALLGALAGAVATARADAPAPSEPTVRVLLLETPRSVLVRGGAALATRLEAAPNGLLADSRPVGSVWRLETGGVLHAADTRVRGAVEVHRVPEGLRVVNRVRLEDYVAGTVGREVYPDWDPEMLKAQAVVARTYALHERGRGSRQGFDLRGGTSGQVYGGVDAETPSVWAAVRATRGEYLADLDGPILAVYHSASGGQTASAEEVWGRPIPYLVSVPVEREEDSPDTYWRTSVSRTTLGRALASLGIRVGPVREVRVIERSRSGRAVRLARSSGSRSSGAPSSRSGTPKRASSSSAPATATGSA
jgi:stage II sporulation protein D